jgi:serine/threonine-protein kinase
MHTTNPTMGAQGNGLRDPEFLALQTAIAGRYSLDRELGRGGMGIVFLARDVALERQVAIKLLPPHLSADPTVRERFLREARTAAQLMHPNIVPIHSVEEHGPILFFVMAYVDGETLSDRVRRGGCLTADAATQFMLEIAWALGYAHGRGVVHRDIKPDNVLLERASGRALVADFGIARVASRPTLSAEGSIAGTLQYMSPEQASTDALDGRSDLYSLGATMYFALSGSPPIDGPTLPVIITRLLTEPAVPIGSVKPGLPPGISEAVMRCLAKSRDDRFASADALCAALRDALPTEPATPPELRMFLREFAVGRTMPVVGIGIMVLSGAFASIGFLDARGAAVIGLLGAALTALFPLSVMSRCAR